jgi:hypothetical protein
MAADNRTDAEAVSLPADEDPPTRRNLVTRINLLSGHLADRPRKCFCTVEWQAARAGPGLTIC